MFFFLFKIKKMENKLFLDKILTQLNINQFRKKLSLIFLIKIISLQFNYILKNLF